MSAGQAGPGAGEHLEVGAGLRDGGLDALPDVIGDGVGDSDDLDWDAEADTGGYRLISTEALALQYRKDPSGLLLVDTRQQWEYRTGHIEGARNFSMEPTWWSRWRKAGELEAFLGPDKERTIVFY